MARTKQVRELAWRSHYLCRLPGVEYRFCFLSVSLVCRLPEWTTNLSLPTIPELTLGPLAHVADGGRTERARRFRHGFSPESTSRSAAASGFPHREERGVLEILLSLSLRRLRGRFSSKKSKY